MQQTRKPRYKLSKPEVDYGPGKDAEHCSICRHFQPPDGCTLVAGIINRRYWCKRFEAETARF